MSTATAPLLQNDAVVGVVDHKNRPARRSKSGGWRSASIIIGVEVAERFAYYGISLNLITYVSGPLGQSTAAAAAEVNAWFGTASLLPVLGAFVADSYLGRYRTVVISSLLYILGLGLLTLSAAIIPSSSIDCQNGTSTDLCSAPKPQVFLFFFSLYLVALAQGGHKPCVQAFGADQFDAEHPEEYRAKSSFFNWWYSCLCFGTTVSVMIMSCIQDSLSWVLGFGIPCIIMGVALAMYLLGTPTYRFSIRAEESPFVRIGRVFVKATKNWRTSPTAISANEEAQGILQHQGFKHLNFLNKALLSSDNSKDATNVSIGEVDEAKAILRLIPIWSSCLVYGMVFAQVSTLFTKQGVTLNRYVGSSFQVPPASLQSLVGGVIFTIIPIYDRILVPVARSITGKPTGITTLQRMGVGMFWSILCMVVAALVERKRLQTALDYGLVDKPTVTLPMSVWWLAPQYLLFGIADVFTIVGLQEFFYDQVPNDLKSIGLSLYLSVLGVGSFLSSFLIYVIDEITGEDGHDSWLSSNLNRGHLDYFYWILAGLSVVAFAVYLYFARSYIYN